MSPLRTPPSAGPPPIRASWAEILSIPTELSPGLAQRLADRFPELGLLDPDADDLQRRLAGGSPPAAVSELESRDPDAAALVHGVIAEYEVEQPFTHLEHAMRHARRAGRWDLLHRIWSENGSRAAIHFPTAVSLAYAALPADALRRYPDLATPAVVLRMITDEANGGDHWGGLQEMGRIGATLWPRARSSSNPCEVASVGTDAMIDARLAGRFREAVALGTDARERARAKVGLGTTTDGVFALARLDLQLGLSHLLCDERDRAHELSLEAYRAANRIEATVVSGDAAGHIALFHAMRGAGPDSDEWLRISDAIDVPAWAESLVSLPGDLARTMRCLDTLDLVGARRGHDAITRVAPVELWPLVLAVAAQVAAVDGRPLEALWAFQDALASAPAPAREAGAHSRLVDETFGQLLVVAGQFSRFRSFAAAPNAMDPGLVDLLTASIALAEGDRDAALTAVLRGGPLVAPTVVTQARRLTVEAAALLECDPAAAAATFATAHAAATTADTLLPYLWIPTDSLAELWHLAGIPGSPDPRIVGIVPRRSEDTSRVWMTARERQILELVATGMLRSDIASALVLSEHTVKGHLQRLYRKLDVGTRQEAVQAARRLGILAAGPDEAAPRA